MSNLQQEISRQMGLKNALIITTNTPGWGLIKELADEVVKQATQEALDEENPQTGESKRLKAKALQKGFLDLFAVIEQIKQFDPQLPENDSFGQIEFSEHQTEGEQVR
jgi:hypothetical protein